MRKALIIAGAALVLAGCGNDEKSERGLTWMPEMYHHPGFKSQTVLERVDADGTTVRHIPMMLAPPAGTVSRDQAPYRIDALDFASAKELVNPLLPSGAVLRDGQRFYNITCAVCHGRDGNAANGYVAPTKARPNRLGGVPSLNGPNVERLSDGELYHIISAGRVRMPSLHAQILPTERWAVVHYLRALNRATLATADAEAQLKQMEDALAAGGDKASAVSPGDLAFQRRLVERKRRDLALVQQGDASGTSATFAPHAPARPEYEPAVWPEVSK